MTICRQAVWADRWEDAYLAVHSDFIESSLLLGALTAQLALAKETVLVCAVLVKARGWLVLTTLTASLLTNCWLCHLHWPSAFSP